MEKENKEVGIRQHRAMEAPKASPSGKEDDPKVWHLPLGMTPNNPSFFRLRQKLDWWRKFASKDIVQLILEGVGEEWVEPTYALKSSLHLPKSCQEIVQVHSILKDYLQVGAIKDISGQDVPYCVPWFIISKEELGSHKLRLILDCRKINLGFHPKTFKMDGWKDIFPVLRKDLWASKIDLKNAYFHLALAPRLASYMNIKVGEKTFQFQSACFGISTLPYWWTMLMRTFQKKWRTMGIVVWIYLDDILIVSEKKEYLENDLKVVLQDLQESGMEINAKKSVLFPTQIVDHLGFTLDFQQGKLLVPLHKIKSVKKELGKLITHQKFLVEKLPQFWAK